MCADKFDDFTLKRVLSTLNPCNKTEFFLIGSKCYFLLFLLSLRFYKYLASYFNAIDEYIDLFAIDECIDLLKNPSFSCFQKRHLFHNNKLVVNK